MKKNLYKPSVVFMLSALLFAVSCIAYGLKAEPVYADTQETREIRIAVTAGGGSNNIPSIASSVSVDQAISDACTVANWWDEVGLDNYGSVIIRFTCNVGAGGLKFEPNQVSVTLTPPASHDNFAPASGTLDNITQTSDYLEGPPGTVSISVDLDFGKTATPATPPDSPWSECTGGSNCVGPIYSIDLQRYKDALEITLDPPNADRNAAIGQAIEFGGEAIYSSHGIDICDNNGTISLLGRFWPNGTPIDIDGHPQGTGNPASLDELFLFYTQDWKVTQSAEPEHATFSFNPAFDIDTLNSYKVKGSLSSLGEGDIIEVKAAVGFAPSFLDAVTAHAADELWDEKFAGIPLGCMGSSEVRTVTIVKAEGALEVYAGMQFHNPPAAGPENEWVNIWNSPSQSINANVTISPVVLDPATKNNWGVCGPDGRCAEWSPIDLSDDADAWVPVTTTIEPVAPNAAWSSQTATVNIGIDAENSGEPTKVYCFWDSSGNPTGCELEEHEEPAAPGANYVDDICVPEEMLMFKGSWIVRPIFTVLCGALDISVEVAFPLLDVNIPLVRGTDAQGYTMLEPRIMFNKDTLMPSNTIGTGMIDSIITESSTPIQVYTLWETSWDISRSLVLLGIVVFSFFIIFRVDTNKYTHQKILTNTLVAVTLAAFSYQICTFMFDLNRMMALIAKDVLLTIYSEAGGGGGNFMDSVLSVVQIGGLGAGGAAATAGGAALIIKGLGLFGATAAATGGATLAIAGVLLLAAVIPCIGCLAGYLAAIIGLFIVLILRMLFLYVMVILAPIAFTLMIIPEFKKIASDWFKTMIKVLTLYPLFTMLYYLLLTIIHIFNIAT